MILKILMLCNYCDVEIQLLYFEEKNGFNLDWLVLIDLYLVTIWLIFEIDQSDSSWAELDQ